MKIKMFLIYFGLLFLITGCKNSIFDSYETVDFYLPQWPPEYGDTSCYPKLAKWKIEICGYEGNDIFFVDNKTEKLSLNLLKNKTFSICAVPVTLRSDNQACCFFKASGAIYPYELMNDKKVDLTWEGGFISELMKEFYFAFKSENYSDSQLWDFIACFNWKKLQENISQKVQHYDEDSFYNPWFISTEEIIKTIANKGFKITVCNLKNTSYIPVECLNENIMSSFIPENKFIQTYGKISYKTNEVNQFSLYNLYEIIVKGTLEKNLSVQQIFLPIFIEDI